jgi:predicted permease
MMDGLGQDVRYAIRSLFKNPAFSLVALVTLALGIGANTAIFSVVNGVILRPLPYPDSHELVQVLERSNRGGLMRVAWPNFVDWREQSASFDALTAYGSGTTTVLGGEEPAWTPAATISEDFWAVFGVAPVAGRLTNADDHAPDAAPVAVVSESFAREVLGGMDAIGRMVEAFGVRREVVGVLPADFAFPANAELWTPIPAQGDSRTAHNWTVVGRLRDGVSVEGAAEELDVLTRRIVASAAADEPSDYLAVGARTESLRASMVGDVSRPLFILLGAAGFVLLVACTNLASTLLARATVRSRELAVRSALGAGRGRLLRQLLTESIVLSGVGALAGLGVASGALSVIRSTGGATLPRLEGVTLDATVGLFTLAVTVLTALAFGLLPALRGTEGAQADALRNESRGNAGVRGRSWNVLVAGEVAMALILLAGSALLMRSFVSVLSEDPGFDGSDVVMTPVALSGVKYPDLDAHRMFWDGILEQAEGLSGASAVGLIDSPPMGGGASNGRVQLDGDPNKTGDGLYVVVSAGAFDALDVPLLQGRVFDERDGPDAPHSVVVSRSFARRYWPDENPLGKQVSGGGMDDYWDADPVVYGTVVGVVGDVRFRDLTRTGEPTVYWHYRQRPFRIAYGGTLVAESATGDPSVVAPDLRQLVRDVDPDVAVRLRYMDELVAASVAERRFTLFILGGFGLLALVLAGAGIYGVVAYTVARRTREMGIRLALGAAPDSVRWLVVGHAMRPVSFGVLSGVAGGIALSGVLETLVYGISPNDPVTFIGVAVLLFATAVLASWIPASRGTRVDPIVTMRAE